MDAPGTFHHVFDRGMERSAIFRDDSDRFDLRNRFGVIFPECGTAVPAWAFLDNHVHLLVRTGPVPLSKVLHRILTGYAMRFNKRHGRSGYLFQGRFESKPVLDDAYLLTLVRYVHRNPLEARIVPTVGHLARYPWCGHGALVGHRAPHPFESVSEALSLFGDEPAAARETLVERMREDREARGDPFEAALTLVCRELEVSPADLRGGTRAPTVSRARTLLIRQAVFDLGLKRSDVARRLGISPAAVFYALRRLS
jgi:REP element-mobilizing transposase RayT